MAYGDRCGNWDWCDGKVPLLLFYVAQLCVILAIWLISLLGCYNPNRLTLHSFRHITTTITTLLSALFIPIQVHIAPIINTLIASYMKWIKRLTNSTTQLGFGGGLQKEILKSQQNKFFLSDRNPRSTTTTSLSIPPFEITTSLCTVLL